MSTSRSNEKPLIALRREDPPKSRRGGQPLADRCAAELDKIAAGPGRWYALLEYGGRKSAFSGAHLLRKARPDFEFTVRQGVVYARYRGVG